ncbi:MAG: hypothetical protein P8Y34_03145 [Anaerolineales bacterium]|jgi:hypothetical protein
MTEPELNHLTLDRPARYEIIVPGIVDKKWFVDYHLEICSPTSDPSGETRTTVILTVDQAALHGLLRYLYTLRLPLVSVKWIGLSPEDQQGDPS